MHARRFGFACFVAALTFQGCVSGDDSTTPPDGGDATVGDVTVGDVTSDAPTGCAARTANDTAGIFVAPSGGDVSSCGTRTNPCQTITYSVAAAKASTSKTTLYLAAQGTGVYAESIMLDAPITIEGGWSDTGGTWTPICDATTSTAVTIQGVTNTTITATFSGAATLRDVQVVSNTTAAPGGTLYGIFAQGSSTNLTLDQVVVTVGSGGAGINGTDGTIGASATDAGCVANDGVPGGTGTVGGGAAAGTFTSAGYVATNGGDAGTGNAGDNGSGGGSGACATCDTFSGSCPSSCGFGSAYQCAGNGVSGCGAQGGTGGTFGTGGGASIAVFVWDAQVTVFGGTFTSGNGGNGGPGGAGGDGGAPTSGIGGSALGCPTSLSNPQCAFSHCTGILNASYTLDGGSAGGSGGAGGQGGQGGGGSGGDSFAIITGGDGGVALNGNPTLAHGDGGTGAAANGTNGAAADRFP